LIGRYYGHWKVGDRIEHEIQRTVTETDNLLFSVMRESKSRPEADIVTFRHELINQRDEVVCRYLRAALIKRSPT
jgi:acyl dehydratase